MWLGYLFVSSPNLAEKSPDEIALQPGHGYLLIRLIGTHGDVKVARLDMTNLDTGDVIVIKRYSRMSESAGRNAWMSLAAIPEGRYFSSAYEPIHPLRWPMRWPKSELYRREAPSSASDIFEIVPGVINYVGDWAMLSTLRGWNVNHNIKTLERLVDRYPEHIKRYEIYLSMMGKKPITLQEFRKIVEAQSNSEIE